MAMQEQRLVRLRAHVGDARDELHALPAEDRTAFEGELARLEEVVADAGAVLDAADARLVPSGAYAPVQAATCAIANDPRAALGASDARAGALAEALALFPVTRPELERRILAAVEDVRQSAVEQWGARHGEAFEAQLEAFRGELARAQEEAADEVAGHVAEIRRMGEESANLVGAIGLQGTAEAYRRHGRRQRRAAEILRGLAVLGALGAVAIALAGALVADPTAESLASGLFASLLLAALAAYFARQSARHRAREEHAAAVQLDLAVFGPFIEPLSAERRDEERAFMARRLFGTAGQDRDRPAGALAAAHGAGANGSQAH